MRWTKPSLKSIHSLFGKVPPLAAPAAAFRVEAVRQMMLDEMTGLGLDKSHPKVFGKISYAFDIQALWYARSDLMTAFASERGETFAREKIAALSELFDGLLPQSFRYDPRASAAHSGEDMSTHRAGPKRH